MCWKLENKARSKNFCCRWGAKSVQCLLSHLFLLAEEKVWGIGVPLISVYAHIAWSAYWMISWSSNILSLDSVCSGKLQLFVWGSSFYRRREGMLFFYMLSTRHACDSDNKQGLVKRKRAPVEHQITISFSMIRWNKLTLYQLLFHSNFFCSWHLGSY